MFSPPPNWGVHFERGRSLALNLDWLRTPAIIALDFHQISVPPPGAKHASTLPRVSERPKAREPSFGLTRSGRGPCERTSTQLSSMTSFGRASPLLLTLGLHRDAELTRHRSEIHA